MASTASSLSLGDPEMIPLYIGISVFFLIHLYHTRIASSFVGTFKDKMYFYLTHLIAMSPMMLYSFKAIEVAMFDVPRSAEFFSFFYMEWVFATTLMLMSLGRLAGLPLISYIRLSNVDALMMFAGHVSMMGSSPVTVFVGFGVGALCFLYILFVLSVKYRTFQKKPQGDHQKTPAAIWAKTYKFLTITSIASWCLYPINQIIYKTDVSSFGTCLLLCIVGDIVSKGIFVNVLIGSNLVYRGDTSVLAIMTRRMLKIHALDVVVTENIDANMTHTVSLTLDMHSPKPGDPPGVAHVTHVSEVGMPKRPVRKSETRKEEV